MQTSKTDESIMLDSKEVLWLGPALECAGTVLNGPPLPASYSGLTSAWNQSLVDLKLGKGFAVLHQLRQSGATWDRFRNYRSILDVKLRGRWASDSSLWRYEACLGCPAVREAQRDNQNESKACARVAQTRGPRTLCPKRPQVKPFLELFAGCGNLSKAGVLCGVPAELWDIEFGSLSQTLSRGSATSSIRSAAQSIWDYPASRGEAQDHHDQYLYGLPGLSEFDSRKVREGNRLLYVAIQILEARNLAVT